MRRRHLPLAALPALILPIVIPVATQATPTGPSQRWIVRFADQRTATTQEGRVRAQGHAIEQRWSHVGHGMSVTLDTASAERLRHQAGVLSVQPDRVVRAADTQRNPPLGLDRVDQRGSRPSRSYTSTMTGAGVRIYVVDSGLNLTHTDFAGRVVKGPDYADATSTHPATSLSPTDCTGHGTHVAGIAAGTHMGVAKKATVIPVKVLGCSDEGTESDVASALDWVATNRAGHPAVVNLSLSIPTSSTIDDAVTRLVASGVTVVTAAGNDNADACGYSPARVPAAITVANATTDSRRATDSNHGGCVDLFAPGTGITSDWIGSTIARGVDSGTSMASPFVAGAAALVLQARPRWTPGQVSSELVGKATPHALMDVDAATPNRLLFTRGGVTP